MKDSYMEKVPEIVKHNKSTRPRNLFNRVYYNLTSKYHTLEDTKCIPRIKKEIMDRYKNIDPKDLEDLDAKLKDAVALGSGWVGFRTYSEKYRKEIEKINCKDKDLSIPKLKVDLDGSALKLPDLYATIYYCKDRNVFKHVERMSCFVHDTYLVVPDQVWSKPKTFPRFAVVVTSEGRSKAWGLGELEGNFEEIQNYIKFI